MENNQITISENDLSTNENPSSTTATPPLSRMGTGYRYEKSTGLFIEKTTIQESPREPGVWLLPPNVTIVSPPSENFIFDGVEWVEHGEKYDNALITIKEQKAKELNEERERLMNEGFEYMNYRFDSDASSATKINAAVTRALIAEQMHQEFSISWTTQDNSEITLNAQEMINLGLAYSQRIDDLHNHCLKLKKEIMTLETIQDVNEFRWRE